MWKELLKAARFAKRAHEGQKRAHGTPYFEHPKAVAKMLWRRGFRELHLLQAAYLHDVLEDTATTPAELQTLFSEQTCSLVMELTKEKGTSYEAYLSTLTKMGLTLKLADRHHNNSELRFVSDSEKHARLSAKATAKTKALAAELKKRNIV